MESNKKHPLNLKALGLKRASDLLPFSTSQKGRKVLPSHEANGPFGRPAQKDPEDLVRAAVLKVRDPALQLFLRKLVVEREILQLLTHRLPSAGNSHRYAIEPIQAACDTVRFWSVSGRLEKEVQYAATLVYGIQVLLGECIVCNATPRDELFKTAQPYLKDLEKSSAGCAALLRQALAWGNEDEVDDELVRRLTSVVYHCMQSSIQFRTVQIQRFWRRNQ